MMRFFPELDSTNTFLTALAGREDLPDGYTVYTYRQTQGRGQRGNRWESEPEANLLFSMLWKPQRLSVSRQFAMSQVASLCVRNVAARRVDDVRIKWPNDIYCGDRKLAGILIETVLSGAFVRQAVVGIGLNVNQLTFPAHLPNPVSLAQLSGRQYDKQALLEELCAEAADLRAMAEARPDELRDLYFEHLYRKQGFHPYRSNGAVFEAEIADIRPNGTLLLRTRAGELRSFLFKEVEFLI